MFSLSALQKKLQYNFKSAALLTTALTHSSFSKNEQRDAQHNERLEFLGDAVLELCSSSYLFNAFPRMSEGQMTRLRAIAVCESALFGVAQKFALGDCIRLSKGEENTGGRVKPSILSDALEAVIGAIYLDGGFAQAERFVLSFVPELIEMALSGESKDYKTRLQEQLQQKGSVNIRYAIVAEEGPDHDKRFTVEVMVEDKVLGRGNGKSKKEAEQKAAEDAITGL